MSTSSLVSGAVYRQWDSTSGALTLTSNITTTYILQTTCLNFSSVNQMGKARTKDHVFKVFSVTSQFPLW